MKLRINRLALLSCIMLAMSLSVSASYYFPAPVAEPQLLLYYDFSRTDFYDPKSESLPMIAQIISQTYQNRLKSSSTGDDANEEIAQFLRHKPDLDNFKVDQLFFYLKDQENFAVILTGNFDHEKIKALYNQSFVSDYEASTIIDLKVASQALPEMKLFVSNEQIMLAAATTIEAYINNLNHNEALLTGRYQNFIEMVNAGPMFAAELSVAGIRQRLISDTIALPDWAKALRHVRVIVDSRLTRLQLVANSVDETNSVRSFIDEQISSFNSSQNLSLSQQNNSIFIEAEADAELEQLVANHTAAFLLHFFVKAELETTKLTSEVEHAAR